MPQVDALGLTFAGLSSLLWLFTTIYAIGYLEGPANRRRFFGFFSLCVASTLGISMAGNLFTLLIYYDLLTLSTYPLVAHRGTPQALAAATVYLRYTLSAGLALMIGMVAFSGSAADQPTGSAPGPRRAPSRLETSAWLLLPALATALLSLLAGTLAGLPFSPLQWATRVVDQPYLAL